MNEESTKSKKTSKKNKSNFGNLPFYAMIALLGLVAVVYLTGGLSITTNITIQVDSENYTCAHEVRCYSSWDACAWEYKGDLRYRENGLCLELRLNEPSW